MKTKMVVMAGLITCATVLHAQDVSTDYPVIVLSQDKEMHSTMDKNLLYWKYGAPTTKGAAQKDRAGQKKPTKIVVIEPSHRPKRAASNSLMPRGYVFGNTCPETAWYEWRNLRLILAKWADFWTNGTDTTPVVLISFKL